MVLVAVASEHPLVPVTVYVIVTVPAATPVTTPVDGLTVAFEVSPLVNVPPVTVELYSVLPDMQMFCVPESVPAFAGAITVTVVL
jgi:hypothetical protein